MDRKNLNEEIGGIDIYILDQILKNRYQPGDKILDAGCGNGRNLKWFYNNEFKIYGTDINSERIEFCKKTFPLQENNFNVATVEQSQFESNSFNHIICNAVLHFAKDLSQYSEMFKEILRILKPQGSLFIRIASDFGIESQVKLIENGVYKLPDGSSRFLLTKEILDELERRKDISFLENVKTTIVHNLRSMSTLVLKKE